LSTCIKYASSNISTSAISSSSTLLPLLLLLELELLLLLEVVFLLELRAAASTWAWGQYNKAAQRNTVRPHTIQFD
jgi:hypothetical protein